ncbi:MAG: bifunctional diaminohydroxyphosphoribosylaminopyrimidine deaminase/5-amino-6-(5-phosphoribosylamino)uracil reductase RibD [Granulosicoccus sp.]
MPAHEHYMQRALALAAQASGCTRPNPLVGCVIVRDNQIVGEGWHAEAGQPHAEIEALRQAGNAAKDATLYVTLEPCSHDGRTPPCTLAIIKAGISRVFYAVGDPNQLATGGAAALSAAGIETIPGVMEAKARYLNRFFLHHIAIGRPWIIAKTATSLDGRVTTKTGDSQWITGDESRARGHQLRQAVDVILVGAQTVITDDPSLTVRLSEATWPAKLVRHPQPVVLDSTGRVPLTHKLFDDSLPTRTQVITTERMPEAHREKLVARGCDVTILNANDNGQVDILALVDHLGDSGVQSVLLEGGPGVHGAFQDAGLIDEVWAFIAPLIIGGNKALSSFNGDGISALNDALQLDDVCMEQLGRDFLLRGVGTHLAGRGAH